jgi:signal transduction histidine kinase
MDGQNRVSGRPGLIANLGLGVVLAGIVAVEAALTAGDLRSRAFAFTVSVLTGLVALVRERNRAWALTGGLLVCAAAAAAAVTAELPSQPGVGATAALLVLGASYVRTADPRAGWVAAVAGIIVLAASRVGLRPALVLPAAALGVVAWGVALGIGLWLRYLDLHRRNAIDAARHDERLLLARELHDVVAHHVAAIVVQTQAAQLISAQQPKSLNPALAQIESAGSAALTAMRQVIGLLRDPGDAGRKLPGPQDLHDLVQRFGARGPEVEVRLPQDQSAWPPEVRTTVYRIVQESLTNIVRHAPDARCVTVMVDDTSAGFQLQIINDGTPSAGPSWLSRAGGYGLVGMRERVEALGGSFDAGRHPDGGWAVRASIPRPGVPV